MPKELIVATKNPGKAKEFRDMLEPRGFQVSSLLDLDLMEEIEETGQSFEENAVLKAEAISHRFGKPVIADDSGLSIDALGGEPGIYSARFAGPERSDEKNLIKVLELMKDVEWDNRTARFRCALAIAAPGRETMTVEGSVEGYIAEKPEGTEGFGYDPIFYVKDKGASMAQLTKEEKNKISHRAMALKKLDELLDEFFQ
ncbi:XTP/dITP diphosphatase [Metabacillus sp. GX 13764]|uniref:XTP/dITP diphosphatase n=1 Tax=Metabacillus kandeliae TaxID=2900151 RepID=UPI001E56D009|nr:XTP/dITP diphosphatase [Metabacillus kandeliae]MCD7032853.1 XTP/dITP diphosphatase [Metabacillus kandeliae]